MKKILLLFSIVLISGLIFNANVLAQEDGEDMSVWNYSLISDTVDPFDTRVTKYKNSKTGKFGFCIEPTQDFFRSNKNYEKGNYSNDDEMLLYQLINAFDNVIKANDASYSENDYYIATQLKIWEIVTKQKPTISEEDYYAYGYKDIEDYIKNNFKEIDIHIDDIDDAVYGEDNYIYLEGIDTENYHFEADGVELIDNKDHTFTYRITSMLPLEKTVNVVPNIDYKKYINDSLFLYKSIDSQDVISYESSYPLFLNGTSFKIKHKTGNIHLEKYDENGNVVYDNIVFHLYDKNNKEILRKDGSYWTISNGVLDINGLLPVGEYYFIEEHIDKFLPNDEPLYFKIEYNKTTNLKVVNKYANFDFLFRKVDEKGNDILDTIFKLYEITDNGEELLFIDTSTNIDLYDAFELKKYDNPSIILSERYRDSLDDFIFNSDKPGYFTYDVYDEDVLVKQGKAYIVNNDILTDGKYKYINVSLIDTIYSKKDNLIDNLDTTKKYILCEYTPNNGYDYLDEPCIVIDNDGIHEYTFVNTKRSYTLRLMKKAAYKQIYLNGAKFLITYKDNKGNIVSKEYITGFKNDGKTLIEGGFEINGIPYDSEVIVREIEAPSGYYIDPEEYVIKADIPYSELTLENIREDSAIIIPPYRPVKTCVE
ncbi:MAG: Cys-Gln thioester bond-forming surface protein [Firmicutes bacterium]|nr:Cys-Gln thioester bond-forming surface protein [Candidatus Colivicinus equi]